MTNHEVGNPTPSDPKALKGARMAFHGPAIEMSAEQTA